MSNTVKLPTCPKCGLPIPAGAPQGLCPKCVLLVAATSTEQGVPATATSEIPSIERIAAAFPQLEILELIGRGGMGFVFKARQPHLDRFVALKLLPDKLAKDALFAERFSREGRVLARLNHPNIVSVYDFGVTGGFCFLLMEYVDGVNLRQAMKAGRFSPAEALALVPKVCEALQYAHEQGILHRDIKPENILLDAKGRVKIADFGIAKLVGEDQPNITLTNTGAALGTPHYMAPEQLEKPATVDHRADIYSLGVVFYEMLTGELPIGRFAAPSSKTPVNASVDDVVFRTLEKDRERRFQSAGEMKTQVEHLGAGSFEQPEAEEDDGDEAPRSWLEVVYSMRMAGWFLAALCLMNFAFPHVTRLGNSPASTYSLGLSRPWLVNVPLVDEHNVVTREWRFNSSTTSFSTGMFGLALVAALLVLRHRVRIAPAVPRSAGRISNWSLYSAIAVGLSLPAPMTTLVALLTGMGGVGPGELWLALGSVALPGLGGTLLGWLALNEIRESRGRVKGLPLAMFATLFWPLTILGALTIGVPMFLSVPGGEPSVARTFGRFLVLLLPAAVIAFGFWTIHATARWASQQQVPQQRGVLKWVFIVVLVVGMGVVMISSRSREMPASSVPILAPTAIPLAPDTNLWVTITFTGGELVENKEGLWIALDYAEHVYGDCQKYWRTSMDGIEDFTGKTLHSALRLEPEDAPEVTRSRMMFRLPPAFSRAENEAQLKRFQRLKYTTIKATPGQEFVLYDFQIGEQGRVKAILGAKRNVEQKTDPVAMQRIELRGPRNFGQTLTLQTQAEIRAGDYIVALLKHPDGRIEELPAQTYVIRKGGEALVQTDAMWHMFQVDSNRITDISRACRDQLDGRVIELTHRQPSFIFALTNEHGSVTEGFIEMRRSPSPDVDKPVTTFAIESIRAWNEMVSVQFHIIGSPAYRPQGIGLYGPEVEVDVHTVISWGKYGSPYCRWNLPPGFAMPEAEAITRQLEAIKTSNPNGLRIAIGERVPMFSVTNQAGTVFRGYFELPAMNGTK